MIRSFFDQINWDILVFFATPLISLLAVFIYWRALTISQKQNKMALSASIIPYYEKEISALEREGKELEFIKTLRHTKINFHALNYFLDLLASIKTLQLNSQYHLDMEENYSSLLLKLENLHYKPYANDLSFISNFFNPLGKFSSFIRRVEYFTETIEQSELTKPHINILKRKIRRILGQEHFKLLYYLDFEPGGIKDLIPVKIKSDYDGKYCFELQKLTETELFKNLRSLDQKLTLS